MKAKPMLCKGSVVRAMMDSRQTQDRRPVSEKAVDAYYEYQELCSNVGAGAGVPIGTTSEKDFYFERAPIQVDDVIWVRENFYHLNGVFYPEYDGHQFGEAHYSGGGVGRLDPWERNEWVWVYEFELTDKPADWPTN